MGTVRYTVFDGEITSEYRNGVLHDYLVDPLGSTVALVDNTQTITDTFSYSAFGEVVNRTGTTPTPFQYVGNQGYYRDSTTRTHVRARNFYVNLGKWSTQDPIGFNGGDFNLYRYCENNPINYMDSSGKFLIIIIIGGLFIATVIADSIIDEVRCLKCMNEVVEPAKKFARNWGNKHKINYGDNNYGNAMQHCVAACEGAKKCGNACSKCTTDRHEQEGNPITRAITALGGKQLYDIPLSQYPDPQGLLRSRCMDLYNNARGINCAGAANCEMCCESNAKSGGLVVLDPKGRPPGWRVPREDCLNPKNVKIPVIDLD